MTSESDMRKAVAAMDDNADFSDPNTYAKLLGGDEADELVASNTDDPGDSSQDSAPAPAPAASAPAPTPAASGAPPSTTNTTQTEPTKVDGVLTRDGKAVIPYAVLEGERRRIKDAQTQIEDLNRQLEAERAKTKGGDEQPGAAANADGFTDEQLADMELDDPDKHRLVMNQRRLMEQISSLQQTLTAQPAGQAAQATKDEQALSDQEQFDLGIAANPLIAKWMSEGANGDSPQWNRAKQLDALYAEDPAFAIKTYADRLAVVQRLVCAEFGIAAPAPAQQTGAPTAQQQRQPVVQEAPDPSLADLAGTPPSINQDPMEGLNARDALAAANRLSDADLRAMAGVNY